MLDLVLWITKFKPEDVNLPKRYFKAKNSDFKYKDFATTLIKFSSNQFKTYI